MFSVLLRTIIIDSLSVERNHVLVRVSVVGGPSERRLPPRDLQEVSFPLNCMELVIPFYMLIWLLLPLKIVFLFCFLFCTKLAHWPWLTLLTSFCSQLLIAEWSQQEKKSYSDSGKERTYCASNTAVVFLLFHRIILSFFCFTASKHGHHRTQIHNLQLGGYSSKKAHFSRQQRFRYTADQTGEKTETGPRESRHSNTKWPGSFEYKKP